MIYELPARRDPEQSLEGMTTRRLSELLAACLGGAQGNDWAVRVIARPRCRVLPFRRPAAGIDPPLHAAGIVSWRVTRFGGRPRGLFCGIGVCFDCLLTVNGVPSLRACSTEARPGDEITTTSGIPSGRRRSTS